MRNTTEQNRINTIYQSLQPEKLLKAFGSFSVIDSLCKEYPQYTHDDIFNMEWALVHNLLLHNKVQAYLKSAMEESLKKNN